MRSRTDALITLAVRVTLYGSDVHVCIALLAVLCSLQLGAAVFERSVDKITSLQIAPLCNRLNIKLTQTDVPSNFNGQKCLSI